MTIRWARILVGPLAAAAGSLFALGAAPASAAPAIPAYGPGPCTVNVTITPHQVARGGHITITISGTCFGDSFTVTIHSTPVVLGTITTDSAGNGSGTFTIPTNLSPGPHTVTVGDSSGNAGSVSIVVTGQPTGGPGTGGNGHLPSTGSNAALESGIGAGAVATGGLLVLAVRKRRGRRFS